MGNVPIGSDRFRAIAQIRDGVKSLVEASDLSKADLKLLSGIATAVNELERSFTGRKSTAFATRPRGRNGGAKERLTEAEQRRLVSMYEAGETVSKVCQEFGVTRGTVYRYLRKHGAVTEAV
ncbi:helix-turn-helix domain-containing protein [Burkholderia multivorans]|uniref:helix-turn-helix domain-containing protein n=1 Tax=Burkholderia multivorans TaxID=87883 RepID=UPI00057E95F0|nr:helix-turn-helix domain-containing protein [Burkholderia multivorans]KHS09408.1 hypothetical protein BMD20_29480 [Burkholderia multivorans]KHS10396.1 hypothetical protein BMD22_28350 [Burkholderia multivorans]MDR9230023.1 hypothetical protein [Burkholderia multivorans]HDR9474387.1 helix-turn-helix domain-containing protein [Burkholderia multivorans]HDR9480229.1 helix-turn-helix domain-containing protein [Burkholderia multivorans]